MAANNIANMRVGSREHVEFSRLLVNTIQEYAIFLLDTSGHIATWSPGAQRIKGYEPDEIIGKHFSVFYPQKDIDAGKPDLELKIAEARGHVEDEDWRVRKDGTMFWANVVITALRDDDDRLVGFAKITRDLSERRKQEEALRKANHLLERQSSELLELNKSKDDFVSVASHQLRTPASGVKQFLGLLMEGYAGELTDKQREFLQRAQESNERQIELIDDLLRVAQVDAGRVILKLSKTRVDDLIQDVVNEQSDSFKERAQIVTVNLPSKSVEAFIDTARFRMVLENILDNAGKYTPEGGAITISLTASASDVRMTIADTGVGIDKDSVTKLFKKFSRIPNNLSETVDGSGLGLYWAYKIVQLHEGEIEVNSRLGEGTVFVITIPKGGSHE
jgi:PAS domain S-box-containing protein